MSLPTRSFSAVALLGALIVPAEALAFCRTMACSDDNPELTCTRDANNCLVNDRPLYWPSSCISFGVQREGSRSDNISYETMRGVVDRAFQTWISADCGGGVLPA